MTARRGDSYSMTKPLGEARPWSRAATLALLIFALLTAGQLALWALKVADLGGIERYIRQVTDLRHRRGIHPMTAAPSRPTAVPPATADMPSPSRERDTCSAA